MRLYPPVASMSRQAIGPDDLAGKRIRKGNLVMVSQWVLHRHRSLWENPIASIRAGFFPVALRSGAAAGFTLERRAQAVLEAGASHGAFRPQHPLAGVRLSSKGYWPGATSTSRRGAWCGPTPPTAT